jgi:hypothetical protein
MYSEGCYQESRLSATSRDALQTGWQLDEASAAKGWENRASGTWWHVRSVFFALLRRTHQQPSLQSLQPALDHESNGSNVKFKYDYLIRGRCGSRLLHHSP